MDLPAGFAKGQILAHYRIEERLGAGGMGVVYRVHDLKLRRDVALKVLPPGTEADPGAQSRLLREARMASALNHPNVCTIHEIGEAGGRNYIAMELVRGRTLREMIPRGGMPAGEIGRLGAQIADALAHAHERHVVHRDLKSANVVLTEDGRAKVLDFGLARRAWEEPQESPDPATTTLTASGTLVGTPHYLAPEILAGHKADSRGDLWALGVLLHEMAAGELPFRRATVAEVYSAILKDPPSPLPAGVPESLRDVIRRCLEKDPEKRPGSAGEVRAALEAPAPQAPARSAPWRAGTALAGLAILVGAGLWLATHRTPRLAAPTERPLTAAPAEDPLLSAALSSDGAFLAYADTTGYYLLDVKSRRASTLPGAETIPRPSGGWGDHARLAWLPDSRSLVIGTSVGGKDSLWSVSLLDRRARRLRDGTWDAAVSPDGRNIAFVEPDHVSHSTIWLMNADGSDVRRVSPEGKQARGMHHLAWSQTGRRLAYLTSHGSADSGTFHGAIETCDLQGGQVTEVLSDRWLGAGWDAQRGLCWLRDGRLLYYLPDSAQSQDVCDLWSIPVDPRTGEVRGRPARVLRSVGSYLSDITASADGKRLALLKWRTQFDIHLVALQDGGTRIGPARRLTRDEHTDLWPRWAPDSRSVYFLSTRNDPGTTYRQGIDERLASPLLDGAVPTHLAAITSDAAWIVYLPWNDSGHPSTSPLMRVPISGGQATAIGEIDSLTMLVGCGTSAGSPCVLSAQAGDELVFYELDPTTAERREMVRIPWEKEYAHNEWSLSPDGMHAATNTGEGALVVDLRTGARTTLAPRGWENAAFAGWAADGGSWFSRGDESGMTVLLHVDPSGNVRAAGTLDFFELVASPDGRWLAVSRRTHEANAWMIEGF